VAAEKESSLGLLCLRNLRRPKLRRRGGKRGKGERKRVSEGLGYIASLSSRSRGNFALRGVVRAEVPRKREEKRRGRKKRPTSLGNARARRRAVGPAVTCNQQLALRGRKREERGERGGGEEKRGDVGHHGWTCRTPGCAFLSELSLLMP